MEKTSRFLAVVVGLVFCLTLAGCSTGGATRSQAGPDAVPSLSFWQPHLLYVLASPHPRLYVEVDAVEGCTPSARTLNKLQDFLAAYCSMPAGIEIVRSDVIPRVAARGIPPTALVHKYLNGPPDEPHAPAPAFMYVLYYSGRLSDKHPSEPNMPHVRQRDVHPHADLLPYPIIVMNANFMVHWGRDEMLLHEAGHMLGLADRSTYASGYHCLGPTCLMNKYFDFTRYALGWQRRLCPHCVAQLADSARQLPLSNLRFVGPVLVRSEEGYHILSLPKRIRIVVGDLAEQDCRDLAAAVRAETLSPGEETDGISVDGQVKQPVLDNPAKMHDIIHRVKNDPYEMVRAAAAKIWSDADGQP